MNKYYKTRLLITDAVFKQLTQPDKYLIRLIDRVFLKGKSQATGIYEISALPAWELLEAEREYLNLFNEAFGLYEKGDFAGAEVVFRRCLEKKPEDNVVVMLLSRCAGYIVSGKPFGWDGTSVSLEK